MSMTKIFDARTTNGDSDAVSIASVSERASSPGLPGLAGETFTFMVSGAFEGATVKIQASPTDAGPWIDVTDGSFTAAGIQVTPLSRRAFVRANLSGASVTPQTSVSVWVG